MSETENHKSATTPDPAVNIDGRLHLGTGIRGDERALVVQSLESIEDHLRPLDQSTLKIEAWIKNRGERGQIAYVSIHAKDTNIVANDTADGITEALGNLRRDLKRQLSDLHDRRTNRRH